MCKLKSIARENGEYIEYGEIGEDPKQLVLPSETWILGARKSQQLPNEGDYKYGRKVPTSIQ